MSVLLSTAYLDEAERCEEVILIHEGRILDQGAPERMSARMAGPHLGGFRAREAPARPAGRPGRPSPAWWMPWSRAITCAGDGQRRCALGRCPGCTACRAPYPVDVAPRFEDGFIDLLRVRTERRFTRHDGYRRPAAGVRRAADDGRREPSSRWKDCGAASATSGPWTASASRCGAARYSVCWAPTARASPPPSACCAACCPPAPEPCGWPGVDLRQAASTARGTHRLHVAEILPLRQSERVPEPAVLRQRLWPGGPGAARTGWTGRWRSSSWSRMPSSCPATCRWATSSAWPWPAR